MEKQCSKCKEIKPIELFKKTKQNKSGYGSWCKKCHSKDTSEKTKKDRTKARINHAKYRKTKKCQMARKRYRQGTSGKSAKHRYNHGKSGRTAQARWHSNRRSRELNTINDLTADEWQTILEKQNYKCNICGVRFDNTILNRAERDHIIPLAAGGGLTKKNVQALCKRCNTKKGIKLQLQLVS